MNGIVVGTAGGLFEARTSRPIAFEGRSIDAQSTEADWTVVDARELWTQSEGWSKVAITREWDLTCVLPLNRTALVGTAEAHLMRLSEDKLETVRAFERVEGRNEWFTPWGGPPDTRSIARAGSAVYVNVHVGGIVKGDGESWEPTIDISADVHEVRAAGDVLIAACAVGFAESDDGGASWTFDDAGLHATYARAVAASPGFLYMSVAHGPRGGDAGIYRKPLDKSSAFSRCDLPSFRDNIDTGCLDASDALVAFGTSQGEVFASSDHGATWERIASGLPPVQNITIRR